MNDIWSFAGIRTDSPSKAMGQCFKNLSLPLTGSKTARTGGVPFGLALRRMTRLVSMPANLPALSLRELSKYPQLMERL